MLQVVLAGFAVLTAVVLLVHVVSSGDYQKHRLYVVSMLGLMVTGPVGLGFRGVSPHYLPAQGMLSITFAQTVFVCLVLGTTTPSWRGVILDNVLRLASIGTLLFAALTLWLPHRLSTDEQLQTLSGLCVIGSGLFKLFMSKARADFAEAEARALRRFALFHMGVGALWIAHELFANFVVMAIMQVGICCTGVFSMQYLIRRTANKEFTPRRRPPKPRVGFDQYILTSLACLATLVVVVLDTNAPTGLLSSAAVCALALIMRQVVTVVEYEQLNDYTEANERRFGLLVRSASDVISLVEPKTHMLKYVSPAVSKLLGRMPEETVEEHVSMVLGVSHERAETVLKDLTSDDKPIRVEGKIDNRAVESIISRSGEHLVTTTRDVTEREALKAQLRELAYNDPLTGLTNRRRFDELLRDRATHNPGGTVLLYIDLNEFKAINDDHGHDAGDQVLEVVAERLRYALPDDAVLGRRGGDEFVAAIPRSSNQLPEETARRVLREIKSPYVTDFGTFTLGCAIGIAYPEHGARPGDMMRNADQAMYAAKRGDNPVVVYTPILDREPQAAARAQDASYDGVAMAGAPNASTATAVSAKPIWTPAAKRSTPDVVEAEKSTASAPAIGSWAESPQAPAPDDRPDDQTRATDSGNRDVNPVRAPRPTDPGSFFTS